MGPLRIFNYLFSIKTYSATKTARYRLMARSFPLTKKDLCPNCTSLHSAFDQTPSCEKIPMFEQLKKRSHYLYDDEVLESQPSKSKPEENFKCKPNTPFYGAWGLVYT
jgi:hypothetical protein